MNDRSGDRYWNYVPCPFWAMAPDEWLKYAEGLKAEDRAVLDGIPFKWAYVPPKDASSALAFLDDVGASCEEVNEDVINGVLEGMSSFDRLVADGSVSWSTERCSDPPPYRFRMTPEWERMSGVILNWPIFYPPLWKVYKDMIEALDHVKTYLRIPEGHLGAAVLAWLRGNGIDLGRVRGIPGPIGDIWPRDYSPLFGVDVYSGEAVAHKFTFAAYYEEYRRKYRYIVDIDDAFAWSEGFRLLRSDVLMDGGSVITDGEGTYVITRRVIEDNRCVRNLKENIKAWLGAERLIVVDEEPGDLLGHVCNFKFVGPRTLVVGKPDRKSTPLSNYLCEIARMFSKLGYDVVEIPCGADFRHPLGWEYEDYPGAYANSLMVNKRILVPHYRRDDMSDLNDRALDVYAELLPGWEVLPIDASIIGNGGGAINCSSKEVPDTSS